MYDIGKVLRYPNKDEIEAMNGKINTGIVVTVMG